jgi:hypothetical protein
MDKKRKENIETLLKDRNTILTKNYNDPKADLMRKQIILKLNKNQKNLSVEYIVEAITHLGHAPSIIYDDNGYFAISETGTQNVSEHDNPNVIYFSAKIEKKYWKTTIRGALEYYLNNLAKYCKK